MNELMTWASSQEQSTPFSLDKLTRVPTEEDPSGNRMPHFWKSSSNNKLLIARFPLDMGPNLPLDPNRSLVLGGMCLLNTIDMKRIAKKEVSFESIQDFKKWFSSWYPRIDQIHDTVGIPPKFCQKAIYVSEDSFFADRLSSYTGLEKESVQKVLHNVHEEQGHPVLERYLKSNGYKGKVDVVYTSEMDNQLDLALKMWERLLDSNFRTADRNFAKVELMYTGFWLDILGAPSSAIIYEAASKMILKGWLKLENWFKNQPYGTSINRNLGIAGYLPFITSGGDSSVLGFNDVPNHDNFQTFNIPEQDIPWYVTNMLFGKKTVVENGPLSLSSQVVTDMIRQDLHQYYGR